MLDGNAIERLERVNGSKRFTIFLRDRKPFAAIGGVRLFVDTGFELLLHDLADLLVNAWRNRYVLLDPRYVW